MEWADGAAQLIRELSIAIGGAVTWAIARRDRRKKAKPSEQIAIQAVEDLEETVDRLNDLNQAHTERYDLLSRDYARARELISQQDQRIARKDQRIAHLESMLDKRGSAS